MAMATVRPFVSGVSEYSDTSAVVAPDITAVSNPKSRPPIETVATMKSKVKREQFFIRF